MVLIVTFRIPMARKFVSDYVTVEILMLFTGCDSELAKAIEERKLTVAFVPLSFSGSGSIVICLLNSCRPNN